MKLLILITFAFIFIGFCPSTFGQPKLSSDSDMIINGRIWVPTHSVALAEQFLFGKLELNGSIKFKGQRFDNLKFSYDIARELVITPIETENNTKRNIVVNPTYLEEFNVEYNYQSFHFKRGDFIHEKLNPNQFYQLFSSSSITYLIKYSKIRNLSSQTGSKTFNYTNNNHMYILHKGDLKSINSKNDIIKLFPLQKKEMKQFIRTNKLKINKNSPLDVIPLLIKFDQ